MTRPTPEEVKADLETDRKRVEREVAEDKRRAEQDRNLDRYVP